MTNDAYRAIRIAGWLLLPVTGFLFLAFGVLAALGSWWALSALVALGCGLGAMVLVGQAGDREYQVRAGRRRLG